MIEKLVNSEQSIYDSNQNFIGTMPTLSSGAILGKINEIVDVVNDLAEQLHRLADTQIVDGGRILALQDTVKAHKKEIDELREHFADASKKINRPETAPGTGLKYNTKWIGKLCKFRDGGYAPWQYGILTDITPGVKYPFWMGNIEFAECQPVKKDEFDTVIME